MKYLAFRNQGQLSVLDLTTMGDSIKRDDSSKIGKFDSGLKYALAILHRNDVKFRIDLADRYYTVSTKTIHDSFNDKSKEVLVINEHINKYYGLEDYDPEAYIYEVTKYVTGFETELDYESKAFSNTWITIVNDLYEKDLLKANDNLTKYFARQSGFNIGKKTIRIPNAQYSWNTTTIGLPKEEELDNSFDGRVKGIISKYNIDIKYPIVESFITGFKVIGDSNSKTLFVNTNFEEGDVWELILGIYSIEDKGISDACKYIVNLIKK